MWAILGRLDFSQFLQSNLLSESASRQLQERDEVWD